MDSGDEERSRSAVLDIMSVQALQRDAYRAGYEIKRAHTQASCVKQGLELVILSADYAGLLLFKEQQAWATSNLYERAALRMAAFCQGYQGQMPTRLEEPAWKVLPAFLLSAK